MTMLQNKHYMRGVIMLLVLFILGFCLRKSGLTYTHISDLLTKIDDTSKKLAHCEKKHLLNYSEKSLRKSGITYTHISDLLTKIDDTSKKLAHCEKKHHLNYSGKRKASLNVLTSWLAPIIWDGIYDLKILNEQHKDTKIGLFVFAVKKYIQFLGPFLESAEHFFMVGHNVTYYVFTDKVGDIVKPKMGDGRNLQLHEVTADIRWQDVSMRRMEILTIITKEQLPNKIDYLVCADVDMVFNDHMGVEILSDLFATLHPGLFLAEPQAFTYERRNISAAYIPYGEGDFYYIAALYGGKVEEIHKLSTACQNGIKEDKKKNIEAVWQEESHFNRYLVYNKPTKVLSPEYLWDTRLVNGEFIKKRRFLAVHKNQKEVRN